MRFIDIFYFLRIFFWNCSNLGLQVNYGISKKTTFSIFKFFKSNQIKRYLYWWNMKSFMGIISEKNISLFKMKESKREKIMESCTPGRYVRTKKRLFFFDRNFSIWQNCSEKQRFYSFSREISSFLCLNIATWFDKMKFSFSFFLSKKSYTLLFALPCLRVCKHCKKG